MILDKVKKYFEGKRKDMETRRMAEMVNHISKSFFITELQGETYIMCNGVAVRKLDPKSTCKQAVDLLQECRDTAKMYFIIKHN